MADTFSAVALAGYSLHTPRGFIIFNAGQETVRIPEEHRARLVREGVIAAEPLDHDHNGRKGGSEAGAESTAAKGAARKKAASADDAPAD